MIDAAVDLVKVAERLEEIDKISLGIIRKCGMSRGGSKIKIKVIPAGLEIVIRGNKFVQTIYLYINSSKYSLDEVTKILSDRLVI